MGRQVNFRGSMDMFGDATGSTTFQVGFYLPQHVTLVQGACLYARVMPVQFITGYTDLQFITG